MEDLPVERERLQRPPRDVQDGPARCLVHAARLHPHVAILDEIDAAHAVLPAEPIETLEHGHRLQAVTVDRNRISSLEVDQHLDGNVGGRLRRVGELEHLVGRRRPRVLEDPSLVGDVEQVAVGGVRPFRRHRHGNVVAPGELDERGARVQLPLPPRRDHAKLRRQRGVRQLEAHLIVALAGGAMGDRVGALLQRDVDLSARDERTRDGCPQQVAALVDGVGPQHGKDEVADEFLAQIDDVDPDRARPERLLADRQQLLALTEVGTEGDHLAAVALDEPAQADGGVEPARVGENDLLRIRHRRGSRRGDR